MPHVFDREGCLPSSLCESEISTRPHIEVSTHRDCSGNSKKSVESCWHPHNDALLRNITDRFRPLSSAVS